MGRAKKTRKFALAKKMISPKDSRVKSNALVAKEKESKERAERAPRQVEQAVSALWFQYNAQLGPPYHVLVDTNFINFSIR
jgi:U3 small nucleolar RNA-associated protein 24